MDFFKKRTLDSKDICLCRRYDICQRPIDRKHTVGLPGPRHANPSSLPEPWLAVPIASEESLSISRGSGGAASRDVQRILVRLNAIIALHSISLNTGLCRHDRSKLQFMSYLTGVPSMTIQGILRSCQQKGRTTAENARRGGRKCKCDHGAVLIDCESPPKPCESVTDVCHATCAADEGLHNNDVVVEHRPLIEHLAGTLPHDKHPNFKPDFRLRAFQQDQMSKGCPWRLS